MPTFWHRSGYQLLDHTSAGRLAVTDAFLGAYLERPEIHPAPESCHAELTLHRDLLGNPRIAVSPRRLTTLADQDARHNYSVFLRFRDALLSRPSLEAFYLDCVRGHIDGIPPKLASICIMAPLLRPPFWIMMYPFSSAKKSQPKSAP